MARIAIIAVLTVTQLVTAVMPLSACCSIDGDVRIHFTGMRCCQGPAGAQQSCRCCAAAPPSKSDAPASTAVCQHPAGQCRCRHVPLMSANPPRAEAEASIDLVIGLRSALSQSAQPILPLAAFDLELARYLRDRSVDRLAHLPALASVMLRC